MAFLKKRFIFLLLLAAIYTVYFFTHLPTHTSEQVLGVSTNIQLFEEPQDGKSPILTALKSAQKEILVEVYLLSDKDIIAALESEAEKGVQVKVMLEQHPFGGGSLNNTTYNELEKNHVSVAWSSPDFALTHEKTIVIDDAEVFILSQNLTTAAFSTNREYDIEDTNEIDVSTIRNIFIADWERKSITPDDPELVISPTTSRSGITNLLESATKSIDIEVEDIGDTQIEQVLADKAKSIPVELIVPTLSQVASNKKALDYLSQEGVQVETLSSPYIHGKVILIDSDKAYTGSENLSTQSLDENREVGILFTEPASISELTTTFATHWSHGISVIQ